MEISMDKRFIYIIAGLILFAWFLISEKQSFFEKLTLLGLLGIISFGVLLLMGFSVEDILKALQW